MERVRVIPIPEQIARRGGKREGLDHLLGGPGGRGSLRDLEMKDFPAIMDQDQEDMTRPMCPMMPNNQRFRNHRGIKPA